MLTYQQTIGAPIRFEGVGVHSGTAVELALLPAEADTGIVFHVLGADGLPRALKALADNVPATDLSTVVGDPRGAHVATVEHLMAALYALGVDNVVVQVDGRETPIMDGGSHAFVTAIEAAGLRRQSAKRRYIRVLRPVAIQLAGARAEYLPHEGTRFEIEIDFPTPLIGRQRFCGELSAALFRDELSRARTFGFMADVERLWASGHALGSSLENSIVIGHDHAVINPDGLRYPDEFVRHKALDAIGDQAMAGARILGCYRSHRGGHRLNALALQALLSDRSAYEVVEMAGRRRETAWHAALPAGLAAAAAFAPQAG